MICSDLHLGSGYAYLRNVPDAQAVAANDEAAFLESISAEIRRRGIQVLLIAGNFIDNCAADGRLAETLDSFFHSIPETYVFISPGNSDPCTAVSPYVTRSWPENVKIFTGDLKAAELKLPAGGGALQPVRIYSGAYTKHFAPPELISETRLPRLNPEYTNILLTHTPPVDKNGCLAPELLELSGFDLCACSLEGPIELTPAAAVCDRPTEIVAAEDGSFGDFNDSKDDTGIVTADTYQAESAAEVPASAGQTIQLVITSSPFRRSFVKRPAYYAVPEKLTVVRGKVLAGELLPGKCLLEPVTVQTRKLCEEELNVEGIENEDKLEEKILTRFAAGANAYRITLCGSRQPGLVFSAAALQERLAGIYYSIELIDSTFAPGEADSPDALSDTALVRYFEKVFAAEDSADDEAASEAAGGAAVSGANGTAGGAVVSGANGPAGGAAVNGAKGSAGGAAASDKERAARMLLAKKYAYNALAGRSLIKEGGRNDG